MLLLGCKVSQISVLQFSESNWGNVLGKQRKEKKRGNYRTLRDNRFPVLA